MYPPINKSVLKTIEDNYDELKSLPKYFACCRLKKLHYGDKEISQQQINELGFAVLRISVVKDSLTT